ncbi:MAG: hypothetical protein RIQ95_1229 [Pseudomonadota bacterium]|jgi:hypothetical protein
MEGDVQPSAHTEINDVCQIFRLSKSCFHEQDLVVTAEIKLKSLILAQIERWRHALHMQVERQRGLRPGGEWRTGE